MNLVRINEKALYCWHPELVEGWLEWLDFLSSQGFGP